MPYSVVDAKSFRSVMEAEIAHHCNFLVDLIFVPDIANWAALRSGNVNGNPIAMAVRDGETGGAGILIREAVDASRVESVLGRIELGGFTQARDLLSTPEKFMRHLVLHELAHLVNDWGQDQEDECDEWAFDRFAAKV
jgi:hypothetical protein